MNPNVGSIDRIIRIIAAIAIAALYFTNIISGTLGIVLLVVAVVFLATSLISFCPLYTLLGIRTNQPKK